jgi:hypothetical protein
MWEKIYKTLYISMKRNENLHAQFKSVLEQLPEGVFIFAKENKKQLLANTEFQKIVTPN